MPEPDEQIAPYAREEMMLLQRRLVAEVVDGFQAGGGTVCGTDRDGAIESDDGRGYEPSLARTRAARPAYSVSGR